MGFSKVNFSYLDELRAIEENLIKEVNRMEKLARRKAIMDTLIDQGIDFSKLKLLGSEK